MKEKSGKVPRMTIEELRKKLDGNEPLTVLDVRGAADYANSGFKIIGALRIPLEELSGRAAELDPEQEVAAYCT